MTHEYRKKELVQLLYDKYGTLLLSRKQAAEATNNSLSSLDRYKAEGCKIDYIKDEAKGKNSRVQYAIDEIAEYIIRESRKTT